MLKITLPINPLHLACMLKAEPNSFVDLELTKIYECSLFIGNENEISKERKANGLLPTTMSEQKYEFSPDNEIDANTTIVPLKSMPTSVLASFIDIHRYSILMGEYKLSLRVIGKHLYIIKNHKQKVIGKPLEEAKQGMKEIESGVNLDNKPDQKTTTPGTKNLKSISKKKGYLAVAACFCLGLSINIYLHNSEAFNIRKTAFNLGSLVTSKFNILLPDSNVSFVLPSPDDEPLNTLRTKRKDGELICGLNHLSTKPMVSPINTSLNLITNRQYL